MSIIQNTRVTRRDAKKKLVCVGDGGCGKTCMLLSYTTGKWPEEWIPTVFDNYVCDMRFEKKIVEMSLWDTAGQADYDRLRPLAYPDSDVILICFALDDRGTFTNLMDKWYPEVKHFCEHVPILLVGCKSDLRDAAVYRNYPHPPPPGSKLVTTEEGQAMADRMGAKYVECSAKDRQSMKEVFYTSLKACMNKKKMIRKKVCLVM